MYPVSMATEDQVVPCDYVGVESGRKVPEADREYVFLDKSRAFAKIYLTKT